MSAMSASFLRLFRGQSRDTKIIQSGDELFSQINADFYLPNLPKECAYNTQWGKVTVLTELWDVCQYSISGYRAFSDNATKRIAYSHLPEKDIPCLPALYVRHQPEVGYYAKSKMTVTVSKKFSSKEIMDQLGQYILDYNEKHSKYFFFFKKDSSLTIDPDKL